MAIRSLPFIFLLSALAQAQVINAATCSSTDIQKALNAVSADGTTVVIPSGSCTWTTTVTYKQLYSTTVQGQTTCIGTPTSSCSDNTIITVDVNRSGSDRGMLVINTAAKKAFRLTGVTFAQINGATTARTYDGSLRLFGNSQSVRVDHCHFKNIVQVAVTTDGVYGVFDHVLAYVSSTFMRVRMRGASGNGDEVFAQPTGLGGSQFLFIEDSFVTGAGDNGVNDCFDGGKFVVRYNNLQYTSVSDHGTGHDTTTGNGRTCRAGELYKNTFTAQPSWEFNGYFLAGGAGILWGNTFPTRAPYYTHVVTSHINREDNATYPQTVTSQGWGYCGAASVSGCKTAGTCPSNWDQNSNGSTGYACLDQPGRGQGDLLIGSNSTSGSSKRNSATGCGWNQACAWPRQRLEPFYEWSDTWNCTGDQNCSFWADYDPGVVQNRDYFLGFGNSSCNPGAGSCTAGVGVGTVAQRPANCTTNATAYPAGNSPGVGYWASDRNTLYVCTGTNTWTAYYTPYTYPHPLQGGSSLVAPVGTP